MNDWVETVKFGYTHKAFTYDDPKLKNHAIILFAYFFNFGVAFLMTGFLRFHLKLASENKTTIENLDK